MAELQPYFIFRTTLTLHLPLIAEPEQSQFNQTVSDFFHYWHRAKRGDHDKFVNAWQQLATLQAHLAKAQKAINKKQNANGWRTRNKQKQLAFDRYLNTLSQWQSYIEKMKARWSIAAINLLATHIHALPNDLLNTLHIVLLQQKNTTVETQLQTLPWLQQSDLHLHQNTKQGVIVPDTLAACLPNRNFWPAWLFKGNQFRYHFFSPRLSLLAQLGSCDPYQLRSLKFTARLESDYIDKRQRLLAQLTTEYQQAKEKQFSGARRLINRRSNSFLETWQLWITSQQVRLVEQQLQWWQHYLQRLQVFLQTPAGQASFNWPSLAGITARLQGLEPLLIGFLDQANACDDLKARIHAAQQSLSQLGITFSQHLPNQNDTDPLTRLDALITQVTQDLHEQTPTNVAALVSAYQDAAAAYPSACKHFETELAPILADHFEYLCQIIPKLNYQFSIGSQTLNKAEQAIRLLIIDSRRKAARKTVADALLKHYLHFWCRQNRQPATTWPSYLAAKQEDWLLILGSPDIRPLRQLRLAKKHTDLAERCEQLLNERHCQTLLMPFLNACQQLHDRLWQQVKECTKNAEDLDSFAQYRKLLIADTAASEILDCNQLSSSDRTLLSTNPRAVAYINVSAQLRKMTAELMSSKATVTDIPRFKRQLQNRVQAELCFAQNKQQPLVKLIPEITFFHKDSNQKPKPTSHPLPTVRLL